jgi:chorismate mutase/prephenate dehydratase
MRGPCDSVRARGYVLHVAESSRELHELRQSIAQIDGQLLALLDSRAKAARRIGELRKDIPPTLPLADQASLRELANRSSGAMPEPSLREIFSTIFSACLALELRVEVAFAGLEGGPSHAAARARFGQTAALVAAPTTPEALDEVSRRGAEFALVPFETSIDGPVQGTITALIASELRIVEMLDVPLDLHLLNRSGHLADVKKIYATASDRASCQRSIEALAQHPPVVEVQAPLLACQLAAGDPDGAALAGDGFGPMLGLDVARRSMLDVGGARARYAVIGRRPSGRTGNEATCLVFSVQEPSGSLLDVLRVLTDRGIRLTKIHSHPVASEAWSYLFCAEIGGHFTDRPLVAAFEEIKRVTRFFKLLGSYPTR